MNAFEQLKKALEGLVPPSAADEATDAAKDMEARAREAGLATKAVDAEAGTKAMAAVKELEVKLAEANTLISKQAEHILSLETTINTRLGGIEASQKAQAERAVKALDEMKGVLATFNAKPTISEPEEQKKLAAIEAATDQKVKAATADGAPVRGKMYRYTYGPNGEAIATPIN